MNRFLKLKMIFLSALMSFLSLEAQAADYNFRLSPFAVVGIIGAEFDYKLGENYTLGPVVEYLNLKIENVEGNASRFGIQGRYFFDPALVDSSWYLTARATYGSGSVKVTENGREYSDDVKGASVGAGGGYHWFWENFNLNLGALLLTNEAQDVELRDNAGNKYPNQPEVSATGLGIEFTMGWMF